MTILLQDRYNFLCLAEYFLEWLNPRTDFLDYQTTRFAVKKFFMK
jgi:hypothetical protein